MADEPCRITGPYLPVGDTDWVCRVHKVDAELRDPTYVPPRGGSYRREDFYCPVGQWNCLLCGSHTHSTEVHEDTPVKMNMWADIAQEYGVMEDRRSHGLGIALMGIYRGPRGKKRAEYFVESRKDDDRGYPVYVQVRTVAITEWRDLDE